MIRYIFGIVGEIASGKSLLASYLEQSYGASRIRFSDPLTRALAAMGLPRTRENLRDLSLLIRRGISEVPSQGLVAGFVRGASGSALTERLLAMFQAFDSALGLSGTDEVMSAFRRGLGEDILARVATAEHERTPQDVCVMEGIRRFADVATLNRNTWFRLIYITAPFEARYCRAVRTASTLDAMAMTAQAFPLWCDEPSEREVPAVGATAHLRIDNAGEEKNDVREALAAYLVRLDPFRFS